MELVWNWWGVPGTFVFVAAWACAIIALRTAPRRILNRHLSVVLVLEGLFGGCAVGFLFFFENRELVRIIAICGAAAVVALPFQYLSFLAVSLNSPLLAPFQSRTAAVLLGFASLAGSAMVLIRPQFFISELYTPEFAPWNFRFEGLGQWAPQLQGLVALFGLIAAVSAYFNSAPGSAARNRAKWFAIAFGVRDIYVGFAQLLYPVLRPVPFWGDFIFNPGNATVYAVYVLLLAYAVLRMQLFDIDLKVKFALHKSTLVALIGGIFIVGSELLETMIPVQSTISGMIVALGILVLLRPIHQIALKITGGLMPGVDETAAYLETRKMEVYRAAFEGAVEDGVVTEKERRILTRLRDKLELAEDDAIAVEQSFVLAGAGNVRPEQSE